MKHVLFQPVANSTFLVQAGFDMEDFDEAEEMNEEDLISLGDEFAKIDLVSHVKN